MLIYKKQSSDIQKFQAGTAGVPAALGTGQYRTTKNAVVQYGTVEYEDAYNRGEVLNENGDRSPELLNEVVIQGKKKGFTRRYFDKISKRHANDGLIEAVVTAPIDAVTGIPGHLYDETKTLLLGEKRNKTFGRIDKSIYSGATRVGENILDVDKLSPQERAKLISENRLPSVTPMFKSIGEKSTYEQYLKFEEESTKHKEKFCAVGTQCSGTANAVTRGIFNKLGTGTDYKTDDNSEDAWYSRDKIISSGGKLIYDFKTNGKNIPFKDLQIGDQVMMGAGYDTEYAAVSKYGSKKEKGVTHRGVVIGIKDGMPIIAESAGGLGLMTSKILDNSYYSGADNNGIRSIVRPAQFLNLDKGIVNMALKSQQLNQSPTIEYKKQNYTAEYQQAFDKNKHEMANTFGMNHDELTQIYRAVIGIGAKESKLNNSFDDGSGILGKANVGVQNFLDKKEYTKGLKENINTVKRLGNLGGEAIYAMTDGLGITKTGQLPFPGKNVIDMEAYKLVGKGSFKTKDQALDYLYEKKYHRAAPFSLHNTSTSKGAFRQKTVSKSGRAMGLNENTFAEGKSNQLVSAMAFLTDNIKEIRAKNPSYTFEKALNLGIVSWNSKSSVANKDLVDFYYDGKDNPNPEKIGYDYLGKVNTNILEHVPVIAIRQKRNTAPLRLVLKQGGLLYNHKKEINVTI